MKKSELNRLIKEEIRKVLKESTIYDKIQRVNNDKFTNGYGFIGNAAGKKYAIVCYNSGGRPNLKPSDVINLRALSKLKGIVDDSIILNIQAYFMQKATKITKMEASSNDIDLLIVTDHNVNSPEVFTNTKSNKQSSLKETSIPENKLMTALKKAGIKVTDDMNVELKGPTGKTKIVTVNSDGNVTMNEVGLKDKLAIAATCLVLASGLVSCTKPKDSDLRPNNTQTEMPSGNEQNAEPVDFLNVKGKDVTMDNIESGLAKWTPKPIKGDTNKYKQPTMKSNVKRVEIRPDSVIVNSNTPWIGYWQFTGECRDNNQQVMIWSQVGDDPLDGIIYNGYQVGPDKADWPQYQLIGGKGYFLSAYKISSFNYDKANNRVTVYMSAPDVDKGATQKLEIDFDGNRMNITNWGSGTAVRVGGMGNFKW
jgi:hypothetical protein